MAVSKNRQRGQPLISRFFQNMRSTSSSSSSSSSSGNSENSEKSVEMNNDKAGGGEDNIVENTIISNGDLGVENLSSVNIDPIEKSIVLDSSSEENEEVVVEEEEEEEEEEEQKQDALMTLHDDDLKVFEKKSPELANFSYKRSIPGTFNQNSEKSVSSKRLEFAHKLEKILVSKRTIDDLNNEDEVSAEKNIGREGSVGEDGRDDEYEQSANYDSGDEVHAKKPNAKGKLQKRAKTNNSNKNSSTLTPLEQQIKDIKLQNMDKILAVQVGYKYKFFAQDAVVVSQILHNMLLPGKLTIDDSNPQDKQYKKFAYCSIPDNRLHIHLQKLMHYNLKVGIVEQVETQALRDAGQGSKLKNVFERKLTNVFTKATYNLNENFGMSEALTPKNRSSSICSIVVQDVQTEEAKEEEERANMTSSNKHFVKFFLTSIELDTGIVTYDVFVDNIKFLHNLETRLKHLNPIEVIHDETMSRIIKNYISKINEDISFYTVEQDIGDNILDIVESKDVHEVISKMNLEKPLHILYLHLKTFELQNSIKTLSLKTFQDFENMQYMSLQANVLTNLEIFENNTQKDTLKGTLIWVLDHTRTSYGYAKLLHWVSHPLVSADDINARLDAVECISQEVFNIFFENLNNWLSDSQNKNLLRTLNRIKYGKTSKKEVFYYLKSMRQLSELFKSHQKYISEQVYDDSNGRIAGKSKLLQNILKVCKETSASIQLEKYMSMINVEAIFSKKEDEEYVNFFNLNNYDNPQEILAKQREIEGIKHDFATELQEIRKVLKKPTVEYKDEVDYLIEVRNSLVDKIVPADWVKFASTKMVSRFKTPNVMKLMKKLQLEKDLLHKITDAEYGKFLQRINNEYDQVFSILDSLAQYDCILSLSSASYSNENYCRPKFVKDATQHINIIDGRNPIIENMLVSSDSYVSNDVHMDVGNNQVMVVTGPNMGGKSSYIKQVALLVIMAQIGCYVPCSFMEISIFRSIFIRMGAQDSLIQGKSTFQMEILDILQILNNFDQHSLLLLDEVGRGTGTIDGMSISHSILKYFIDLKRECPLILFITHFHSIIKTFHNSMVGVYHMSYFQEKGSEDITFLYKLAKGYMDNSFGMNVAKLAHINLDVVEQAHAISESLKQESELNKDIFCSKKIIKLLLESQDPVGADTTKCAGQIKELSYYIDDL